MDKIILIILLVVAVVLGIIFSMVFYNRGKQKIEDKYEKLGKDASKIIDDAEKEGQAQKKELLREGKEELEKSKSYSQKFLKFFDDDKKDEEEFDNWHGERCKEFFDVFSSKYENFNQKNKYGKAQKVINMTFKYIYCLKGAEEKEKYFEFIRTGRYRASYI